MLLSPFLSKPTDNTPLSTQNLSLIPYFCAETTGKNSISVKCGKTQKNPRTKKTRKTQGLREKPQIPRSDQKTQDLGETQGVSSLCKSSLLPLAEFRWRNLSTAT